MGRLTKDASDRGAGMRLDCVKRARKVPEVIKEHLPLRGAKHHCPTVGNQLHCRQRVVCADKLFHRPLRVNVVKDALLVEAAGQNEAAIDG